eukprot:2795026-Amphidinium_carterae.1
MRSNNRARRCTHSAKVEKQKRSLRDERYFSRPGGQKTLPFGLEVWRQRTLKQEKRPNTEVVLQPHRRGKSKLKNKK